VALDLDVATGERVGPGCRAGRQTRRVVRVVQPPALRRWHARQGAARDPLPPLAAACTVRDPASPPRIVQPALGAVVVLVPGLDPASQELPLAADLDQPDGPLWWYVDGALLARTPADQQAWWTPSPGRHEIVVLASNGTGDRRWVEVRSEG
jgi:membrane carboxypeptidase/penicillin-binding protein PbpC